jgi:methylated-DNA-[protein]-cysteine S-methyltransferase
MTPTTARFHARLESPIGPLLLTATRDALSGLYTARHRTPPATAGAPAPLHPPLAAAARQLSEYFGGLRGSFDLPVSLAGTPFQRAVWAALQEIPYGNTVSYAQLAARLGRPSAARAVGAANGRNPLSIVVPCHRVVGADGALTGYVGGTDCKRWLLDHESQPRPALT